MSDIAPNNEIEELKREMEARKKAYAEISSEKARKKEIKATYGRYMRQAEGKRPFWTAIAAALLIVFVATLGDAIVKSISGDVSPGIWIMTAVICTVCVAATVIIAVRDIKKRKKEAKKRLDRHIRRYDAHIEHLKKELDGLCARLAELEKREKNQK